MIRLSMRRKIVGIALVLIVLMTIAALVSTALVIQVGERLEDLTQSYVPAYAALARANIHSIERARNADAAGDAAACAKALQDARDLYGL